MDPTKSRPHSKKTRVLTVFFHTSWGPWSTCVLPNVAGDADMRFITLDGSSHLTLQVAAADPRHPVAFPILNKPHVFVLARYAIDPNVTVPAEVVQKLNAIGGYNVDKVTSEQLVSLPVETPHHYVEVNAKVKIAQGLWRKQFQKKRTPKAPVTCPHCGKEAGEN